MAQIIGHVVGLDEITKRNLIKGLPAEIKVVDIDAFQQQIYNNPTIAKLKIKWSKVSQKINATRKQINLIRRTKSGSKRASPLALEKRVKEGMKKRTAIKIQIHDQWRKRMTDDINTELKAIGSHPILFLGFNIFPKDYRQKIILPNEGGKIMADSSPDSYASNQIQFYLEKYSAKIIKGTFPINLLTHSYLKTKFMKFTNYYANQGYDMVKNEKLLPTIEKLWHQKASNVDSKLFIATTINTSNILSVPFQKPLQFFKTTSEAIRHLKSVVKRSVPYFIYTTIGSNLDLVDGKFWANKSVEVKKVDESILT